MLDELYTPYPVNCCWRCESRKAGCHAKCEVYQSAIAERSKKLSARNAEREIDSAISMIARKNGGRFK